MSDKKMTDAEKMLRLMMEIGEKQQEEQQVQFDNMGRMSRMMYDGFVKAGFSPKMAFELVKTTITASIAGVTKK